MQKSWFLGIGIKRTKYNITIYNFVNFKTKLWEQTNKQTNKQKLGIKLKYLLMLFAIPIFLFNCDNEDLKKEIYSEEIIEEPSMNIGMNISKITTVEINQNQTLISKLSNLKDITNKQESTTAQRTVDSALYGFSFDTDHATYIESSDGNYHSYTFQIVREEENGLFENLLVTLNEEGTYDLFIISYDLTESELAHLLVENTIDLTDKVLITPIEDESIIDTVFSRVQGATCVSVLVEYCLEGNHVGGYDGGSPCPAYTSSSSYDCNWGGSGGDNSNSGDGSDGSQNGSGGGSGTGTDTNTDEGEGPHNNDSNQDGIPDAPYTAPTCSDCPELEEVELECVKIDDLFSNNPTLQQELISLKSTTSASAERGKYKLSSTSLVQNSPIGTNGAVELIIPTGSQKYEMIAHTHNAPANATYSVFSFEDLLGISNLLRNNKINTSSFVSFLTTADGTNYAFTVNNPTLFLNVFATKFDSGFDYDTSLNTYKLKDKYYTGSKDESPLIIENNTDLLKDEKLFLDFLKDVNMGITLFEVNDTFDSFEEVTYNRRTDSIEKENCNE